MCDNSTARLYEQLFGREVEVDQREHILYLGETVTDHRGFLLRGRSGIEKAHLAIDYARRY